MYIIQDNNPEHITYEKYLIFDPEAPQPPSYMGGWILADKEMLKHAVLSELKKMICNSKKQEEGIPFIFDIAEDADLTAKRFIIYNKDIWSRSSDFVIREFHFSDLNFERPDLKTITNAVKMWKEEAHIKGKVFISTHQIFWRKPFMELTIGTKQPGLLIGRQANLVEKYKKFICDGTVFINISIIETDEIV